jgi:ABC-type multidrug transport system ATPase subunit
MKLLRLYIEKYRVLQDLNIKFSTSDEHPVALARRPDYALDFLVGVNGTGKSTVLQILSDLMQRLERGAQSPIPYLFELEYDLDEGKQKRRIKVSNLPDEEEEETEYVVPIKVWENGKQVSISNSLLPKQIIAYTTGSEEEWKKLGKEIPESTVSLDAFQSFPSERALELAIRELPGKPYISPFIEEQVNEEQIFLLIQSHQLDKVILCALLADLAEPENRRLLKVLDAVKIKIDGFVGFSLRFRKTHQPVYVGDWDDVEELARIATRRLRLGTDYLLVFDLKNQNNLIPQKIIDKFFSGLNLFKKLARLANINTDGQSVLREVDIFVERPSKTKHPEANVDSSPLHLLKWFSDGERNFLARMCLLRLISATESLILLDEPEVHFNDLWKRQIVQFLDETLKQCHSHVLITTHSSITLTDVAREDVIVLDRNGSYTDTAINPAIRTLAADPSDIMVHVFGAPHPAGEASVERIERELEALANCNPEQKQQALEGLLSVVAQGYWSYRIRRELSVIERE